MEIVAKLYVNTLRYNDLLNEFKHLSDKQLREIRNRGSAFVDWLVDPSVSKLSSKNTQKFRRLIQYAIKQKLELLLTAFGPVKVEETPSRLLRCRDFVSINFLKTIFLSETGFELIDKNGEKYVKIAPPCSNKKESSCSSKSSALSIAAKVRDQKVSEKQVDASDSASTVRSKSNEKATLLKENKRTHSSNEINEGGYENMSSRNDSKEDPRASQLRFLFKCQPDVVAALQPTVTLNELFKAFTFWKSYCTHCQNTFITWLLDMAEFRYSKQLPSTMSYSLYVAAVEKVIAREANYYITAKPRTSTELMTLVSKNQTGFIDEKFLVHVLQESPATSGKNTLVTSILSPPRFGNLVDKQDRMKSFTTEDNHPNATDATNSVNRYNLTVIDPSCDMTCRLHGVIVPKNVLVRILPLLTDKVSWISLSSALKKIAFYRKDFLDELSTKFVSFIEFLFDFADKFKSSLDMPIYSAHLSSLLFEEIKGSFDLCPKKFIKLDDLFDSLQVKECHFNLVHKRLFLNMLATYTNAFHQNEDAISICNTALPTTTKEEIEEWPFEKVIKLPQIKELLLSKFEFIDVLQTYQLLPANVKQSLSNNFRSFYSLLFDIVKARKLESKVSLQHLRRIILNEIERLFHARSTTSLPLIDIQAEISCGDFSLIHCLDIRDAVENSSSQNSFEMQGSWMLFKKPETASHRGVALQDTDSSPYESSVTKEAQTFLGDVYSVLESSDVPIRRLKKVFFHFNQMSNSVKHHIRSHNCSPFRYLIESLPSTDILYAILKQELIQYLRNATYFAGALLRGFFEDAPDFMDLDELIDFLVRFEDTFVIVGHAQVGNIVCSKRLLDSRKNIMFFDQWEEITFIKIQEIFPNQKDGVLLKRFFDIVWHSTRISIPEHHFIFGIRRNGDHFTFHELHFRRYVMMYPSAFYVSGKHIFLNSAHGQRKKSPSLGLDDNVLSEEGQITSSDDEPSSTSGMEKASYRRRKVIGNSEENQACIAKKRKRKRRKKKHSSRKLSRHEDETDQSTVEALTELINFLPDNLIQDVAVGRLLSSGQHQMKLKELSAMLAARLLREKKEIVWKSKKLVNTFESKVISVLKQGSQFRLEEDVAEDGCHQTVCLVVQIPMLPKPSTPPLPTLAVFRWITRLTGVSHKKLAAYIKKVLEVNRKPLNLSIVFTMISQKYAHTKTVAETPSEVLHCQAVSCMKSDRDIFVNCIRKTCCLKRLASDGEQQESFRNAIKDISEEEITSFISECLQGDDVSNGLSVDELATKVAAKFGEKLPALSTGSFRIIVQSLVAESQEFGFTLLGKVACQTCDATCLSEETLESSSEGELKMDVSDDETVVFPDSTNKDSSPDVEPRKNSKEEVPVEEMYNNYIEADVIRCEYESPKSELGIADSTTFIGNEIYPLPSSSNNAPKDPRVKGKAFQNMLLSKNDNPGPSLETQNDASKEKDANFLEIAQASSERSSFSKNGPHHLERFKVIEAFAIDFLLINGSSCETQKLVDAAYNHFKHERFSRSILGLEAYVRDFVATSDNAAFSFANNYGGVGASWIFYRPSRFDLKYRVKPSIPCSELLPEISDVVYTFLNSKSHKQADLTLVCQRVADCFSQSLVTLDPNEVLPVCRNLVLITCIRNLKWFFFAKAEEILRIRQQRAKDKISHRKFCLPVTSTPHSEETRFLSSVPTPEYYTPSVSSSTATIPQNRKRNSTARSTVSALQQMADILRQHGPCKKAALRELWLLHSASHLQNVFGTGVSFSLSLRKFDTYFPTDNDGRVYIDETAFENFLRENL